MGTEPPYYSSDLSHLRRLIIFQHQRCQHDRSACHTQKKRAVTLFLLLAEVPELGRGTESYQHSTATVLSCNDTFTNGKTRSKMVWKVSLRRNDQGAHEDRRTKHCHCLPCISPLLAPSAHNNRIKHKYHVIRGAAILTTPVGKDKRIAMLKYSIATIWRLSAHSAVRTIAKKRQEHFSGSFWRAPALCNKYQVFWVRVPNYADRKPPSKSGAFLHLFNYFCWGYSESMLVASKSVCQRWII